MKKILLLATAWEPDYWESDKEAPYPKTNYADLPEWDDLSKNCPLPGIGRYIIQKNKDYSSNQFVYLKITGMRYDPSTKQPYFDFKTLMKSKTESYKLKDHLPKFNQNKLFFAIESEKLIEILKNIGEDPPEEWLKLIEIKEEIIHWKDYIGKYFLEMEVKTLSNDEFEDRVFVLLNAIGFNVTQKGHTLPGEYPDGIASFDDYAVVYDCKNTSSFSPSSADIRATTKYLEDEKKIRREKNMFSAFIAKSFGQQSSGDIFYFTINSLTYLLFKKLLLGSEFTLDPIKKILTNKTPLTTDLIDKEWRK
ncbi:MAG: hypothetical protein ACPLPX_09825 [Candidatus Kapaibacteriota bacterium]